MFKKPTLTIILVFVAGAFWAWMHSIRPARIQDLFGPHPEFQAQLDSMAAQNRQSTLMNRNLYRLFKENKLDSVTLIVDRGLRDEPYTGNLHEYRGMVFEARGRYDSALNEYTRAGRYDERAAVYVKMKKYDWAITDYYNEAQENSDYDVPLAETYLLANQKDSAIKYYKVYLSDHPDDTLVREKMEAIKAIIRGTR